MALNKYILKRYEIKQEILRLGNTVANLRLAENYLDDMITYKALLQDDVADAERFKRLHLDTRKEGLFKLRVKNSLKMSIPELK